MGGDTDFSEDFDAAIDKLIPDAVDNDITEAAKEQAKKSGGETDPGWFAKNLTTFSSVDKARSERLGQREIGKMAEELEVPKATEKMGFQLFKQSTTHIEYGIIEFYAGAAFYCACKVTEVPVTPDEVADAGPKLLTHKILLRRSKKIGSKIGLNPEAFLNAENYVEGFCDDLNADKEVRDFAIEIIRLCEETGIASGRSTTGWAAAAIYNGVRLTGSKITQQDIADVADVTEVTIRNRYQEQRDQMWNHLEDLEDPHILIENIGTHLQIEEEIVDEAKNIFNYIKSGGLELDNDQIPNVASNPEEEPLTWCPAIIRVASENNSSPLAYRTLKTVSKQPTGQLKSQSRLIRNQL